jgi:hydroxyacyl-ACP dehydratase HTD2-like protein with hotdog domain
LPSDVPESAIPKQYYFVMLSNPVADTDSDNDGYDDIDDLNPLEFDCYDFLDNETYT